ncbi:MAG: response regulator transcription factor [Lachnospiraceae bacterium]|nr:response regulator transcription factor [Lachnospiraceae bacterium]
MIKVMIVEDEPEIRKILGKMIEKQEGFTVVAACGDFAGGITAFMKYRPEVVFMDIDLAGESGLDCAKTITELEPKTKIIFATAHCEYMANAFEIYAFDYLVKPFDLERVTKTLTRIKEIRNAFQGNREVAASEESDDKVVAAPEQHKDKLMIKGKEQMTFLDKKDIILVERLDGETIITTRDGEFHTSASLGSIEEKLDATEFMRCHKSYIINLSMISQIEVYGRWTYTVKLKGTNTTALMTSQKYEEVKQLYE